jgi:transcriptional regulator with XRE-family HTH domain
MGMSHAAIGMYELDVRQPKLGVLRLWAMRCGVPLEWLLDGESTGWYIAEAA